MKNNFNDTVNNFFKNYQDRGMKKWQGFMLRDLFKNAIMYYINNYGNGRK